MKRIRRFDLGVAVLAGLVLGGIVHLLVVLRVPAVASFDAYGRLAPATVPTSAANAQLIASPLTGATQVPDADPSVATAVCAYDLDNGPVRIAATTSGLLQSISLHARGSVVFYALTDRAAVRGSTQIAVMTQEQLDETVASEDADEPVEELRIVAPSLRGLIAVRALAPFPSLRADAEAAVKSVTCTPEEEEEE